MVFISSEKTTCFGLWRPSSGFDNFLAERVLYNMPKPRGDVEISHLRIMNASQAHLGRTLGLRTW